jgi:hypothetical protein
MFTEKDGVAWEGMLSRYGQVLQLVSDGKKKKAPKTLVQLDGWCAIISAEAFRSRTVHMVTLPGFAGFKKSYHS